MASQNRVGGTIYLRIDGVLLQAKGNFEIDPGYPKRDDVVGASAVHGYSEKFKAPKIKGAITDDPTLDWSALMTADGVTATLELSNGKAFSLFEAWWSADGKITTEEGEIEAEWTGKHGEFLIAA